MTITPAQVLGFRVRAQQLDRPSGRLVDTAICDIGVQDSARDGGLWALANRGVDVSRLAEHELATLWTIRGAPHLYRRADLASVAAAVEPFSDADAGKRIFDASKPLKAAGIGNLAALDAVAAAMRSVVTGPMVKGEVSTLVTALMDPPYLRFCRPCDATHLYEQPFRLAALRAGLELRAGTSPPVLEPIPDFTPGPAAQRHDVIRAYLRLLGPATPKHVAEYLDSPVREVTAHWPADATELDVDGETRWVLATDADRLTEDSAPPTTRLLGPFDLFLQARDRPTLVADPARAKALWPVLGRPGAVLLDGGIAGMWRPRKSGATLTVAVELWVTPSPLVRDAVTEQAERLAAYRQLRLAEVDFLD